MGKSVFWQRFSSCEIIICAYAGLCPDWESWDTVHRVSNTKEAMQQADDWLGIPQVSSTRIIYSLGVHFDNILSDSVVLICEFVIIILFYYIY